MKIWQMIGNLHSIILHSIIIHNVWWASHLKAWPHDLMLKASVVIKVVKTFIIKSFSNRSKAGSLQRAGEVNRICCCRGNPWWTCIFNFACNLELPGSKKRPNVAGKDTEKVSKDNQKSLYIFQSLNLEKNKTEDIQYPDIQPLFPSAFSAPLIIPHFSQYQNLKACSNI